MGKDKKPQEEEEWEDVDETEEEEEEEDETINNPDVVMKYKKAANFTNEALKEVVKSCVEGAKVHELCKKGDDLINGRLEKVFRGIDKAVAFPTSINVNSVVCHNSPDNTDTQVLAKGDVVRVDLAVHIDGYVTNAAHTLVVGEEKPTGKAGTVIAAAATALNTAIRKFRPGTCVYEITETLEKVAEEFGVQCVDGVLSHQMKRYIIDGSHCAAGKDVPEHKVWDYNVEPHQVWSLDVVMTTGKGKLKEKDVKTAIYKQCLDANYQLKLDAARQVFADINNRFQTFPFAVRSLDAKKGRLGLSECIKHGVVQPYPVLQEREGEAVAHFKVTLLVTGTKIERITGLPLPTVDQPLKDEGLIATSKLPMAFVKKDKK